MSENLDIQDKTAVREMLSDSGYSDTAINYYLDQPEMGSIKDADQVTELTGPCGDSMKVYLKVDKDVITDAKIQVLGCPGAVSSAMVAMELARGRTLDDAGTIGEGEIFKILENIPDQKQHCIQLSVKTLHNAIDEYKNGHNGD